MDTTLQTLLWVMGDDDDDDNEDGNEDNATDNLELKIEPKSKTSKAKKVPKISLAETEDEAEAPAGQSVPDGVMIFSVGETADMERRPQAAKHTCKSPQWTLEN